MSNNQPTGKHGELIALTFLGKKGFKLITSNFHSRFGEIDLIMQDGQTLVFIEVKARFSHDFGFPQEAVTPGKIRKIIRTGQYFSTLNPTLPTALRIDVIAILLGSKNEAVRIEHIENITG